jgi:nucleotide-binding universal stress UspA family protein
MIPPRQILAAVDFSDPSRVALGFAARLARQCGARLHVLHVEDPLLDTAARATGVDLAGETREELGRIIRTAYPGGDVEPRYHVIVGRAVDVICDLANRIQADLIVTGTRGMSGPAYAIFGSTTEGVLVRSDVSVLVVPASWTPPPGNATDLSGLGPIAVGIELTAPALAATGAACRLATRLETTVVAVHAVAPIRVLDRWKTQADAAVRDRVDALKGELSAVLQKMAGEVSVRLVVETGDIAERLTDAMAQTSSQGLVVLGRRSPGSRSGPPGAMAARILARCPVPVLMYLASD